MSKYLVLLSILLTGFSFAKEHPANISQIWINKTTPGYIRMCGPGNYGESTLTILNKSDSYYQIETPSKRYFFTPDVYDIEFECDLKTFSDGVMESHYVEVIKQRVSLIGGKVYDVQLKLKDTEKFKGCNVEFYDKYSQKRYESVILSNKIKRSGGI